MRVAGYFWKGVFALLLGLMAAGSERGVANDIQFTSFDKLATSSTASSGDADTGPFIEESTPHPKKPTGPSTSKDEDGGPPCCPETDGCDCFMGAPGRFWFQGEYMHWWTSGAHLPTLVSTVDANFNLTGTDYGDRTIGDGDHDGYRVDFGMWLDCCHIWGVEGEYFDLRGRPENYDSGLSNGYNNGTFAGLVRVLFDPAIPAPQNPQISQIAIPTQYVGRVTVDTSDYFQSAGLWVRRNLWADEWATREGDVAWTDRSARTFRLDTLAGYRFMRLIDTVNVQDNEMDVNAAAGNYWTEYTNAYNYRATNNFNGAELGFDATMTRGRFSLDIVTKAAIGVCNQDLQYYNVYQADASVTLGPGTPPTPQVITQDHAKNVFAWVPELTVTAGYQATDHVKFTVGYDLIYWSAVIRAADQIAEPTTGIPYGALSSATQLPTALNTTYFWAQGLRLGGEIRF